MLHRERSVMLLKLDGMGYGFFIPFFFVMVGVEFDPAALKEFDQSLFWFLGLLLIVLFAVKLIPSLLWRPMYGFRKAIAGGFLMSSRLSLIIAASAIGLEMGVITPGINAGFIIMAIITCFVSPVIYNLINPSNPTKGEKLFIIGGSSTGVLLARRMALHSKKSVIIELNRTRAAAITANGLYCVEGDGLDPDIYARLQLRPTDYLYVDTGNGETNYEICNMLRRDLMHDNIITRGRTSETRLKLKQLGVNILDSIRILATTIENLVLRPTTYHAMVESFESFSVEEILITEKEIDGRQVKEIPFHKDAILMMVTRNDAFLIPQQDTYLRTGDKIHVFGTDTAINHTSEIVGGKSGKRK